MGKHVGVAPTEHGPGRKAFRAETLVVGTEHAAEDGRRRDALSPQIPRVLDRITDRVHSPPLEWRGLRGHERKDTTVSRIGVDLDERHVDLEVMSQHTRHERHRRRRGADITTYLDQRSTRTVSRPPIAHL